MKFKHLSVEITVAESHTMLLQECGIDGSGNDNKKNTQLVTSFLATRYKLPVTSVQVSIVANDSHNEANENKKLTQPEREQLIEQLAWLRIFEGDETAIKFFMSNVNCEQQTATVFVLHTKKWADFIHTGHYM